MGSSRTVSWTLSLVIAASAVGLPSAASALSVAVTAGSDGNADAERARVLFEQGVQAFQDSRYADALRLFDDSRRARRTAAVALNRGVTLRAMGRLVEARESFREFFELASDRLLSERSSEVRNYLNEIARRVAVVHVDAITPETAALTVDDRRVIPDAGNNFDVDPGRHTLIAESPGFLPARFVLSVADHSTNPIRITLARSGSGQQSSITGNAVSGETATTTTPVSTAAITVPTTTPPRPAGGPSIVKSPVFWSIIGVVVLAGVAGGVVGWYVSTPADPPPSSTQMNIRLP